MEVLVKHSDTYHKVDLLTNFWTGWKSSKTAALSASCDKANNQRSAEEFFETKKFVNHSVYTLDGEPLTLTLCRQKSPELFI